jgi:hypothetical protein
MPYELSHLNALWDALGKTTVRDEDGEVVTDEPFLHFPTGRGLYFRNSEPPAMNMTGELLQSIDEIMTLGFRVGDIAGIVLRR